MGAAGVAHWLPAVGFHARAATLASLSPRDLYSVNLGSVVCETSIRPPLPLTSVILRTSGAAASALERKRRLAVAGAAAKGIRRMRDLYRAEGGRGARGAFGSGGSSHRLLGLFFLRPLLATYRASQFFLSTAAHATHSLSPRQHEKSPLINYCFLPNKQQSEPRSPVIYTLK